VGISKRIKPPIGALELRMGDAKPFSETCYEKMGQDRLMELIGRDLVCVRGGREVFSGLGFRVCAGEALVLTGPNGAGKTSLLRMIAGLLRPAAGQIELAGGEAELGVAEQAHYLGHQDALKPSLTVYENLQFWASYLGRNDEALAGALAAVGLEELVDLPAGYLSAGQRRRLSLARLLAVPRLLWLLDEPTAALDIGARERLTALMREHLGGRGIIIVATHGPLGLDAARHLRLGAVRGPDLAEPAQ
jgi:heme exporter protein A